MQASNDLPQDIPWRIIDHSRFLRTLALAGALLAAALPTSPPAAAAAASTTLPAASLRSLSLTLDGFPHGGRITDTRIDRTAAAVDREALLATSPGKSTQGRRYAAAGFYGSLYQYALLPRYTVGSARHGRSVQLMVTIFPSESVAKLVWQADVAEVQATYGCMQVGDKDVTAHQFTCTFASGAANAFVIVQHDNVEFITYGFIDYAVPAAGALALSDAVNTAHNELFHTIHVITKVENAD